MQGRPTHGVAVIAYLVLAGLTVSGCQMSVDRLREQYALSQDRGSAMSPPPPRSVSPPAETARPGDSSRATASPAVGVYVVADHTDPEGFERDLEQVVASGSTWIRMGMPSWVAGRIHRGTFVPNESQVRFYVDAVKMAKAADLKIAFIQANALNSDSWTDEQFLVYNSQYWEYVSLKFGAHVDLWQVFNEHDASDFRNHRPIGSSGQFPRGYLDRLRLALTAARTALQEHSDAPITSPPLGYPINAERYARWETYFDALNPTLDVISVHAYPGSSQRSIDLLAVYLNRLKTRYGKPVAVTEFGVPSVRSSGTDDAIGQAIARQIEAIASVGPFCAIVYQLRDRGTRATDSEQMFGLVRSDFTRKPYFRTVADEIKRQNLTVSVSKISRDSVTVSWTAVVESTGYVIGRDGRNGAGHGPWSTTDPARARSRVFTGLRANTEYTFSVRALPSEVTKKITARTTS